MSRLGSQGGDGSDYGDSTGVASRTQNATPASTRRMGSGMVRMANARPDQEALRHRLGGMEKIIEKLAA